MWRIVTSSLHSNEGITPWRSIWHLNGNAKAVRAFPGATYSLLFDAFKTIFSCCTPDRWICHSVRASPPWATCSPIGAVVDQQVQTYLTKLLRVLSLLWRLHVASRKPGCSYISSEEAGKSRSSNACMGFVIRKAKNTAKKFPQIQRS